MKSYVVVLSTLLFATNVYAFGPCLKQVPENVSYLPSVAQCGGKAAIVLSGKLINSFSVVLRTCQNGDRDPCYDDADSCGTNASSPFKVQKVISATINRNGEEVKAKIHCLKEKGSSKVYKMVRRFTVKKVNPVQGPSDILRYCLPSRTTAKNTITIVSTGSVKNAGNVGFNSACLTQKYLGCDLTKKLNQLCPQ